MNCSDVQRCLSAYHDGELPEDFAAEVAIHLRGCPSCAAELASFDRLSKISRQLIDPSVPTRMWEELETKLRGENDRTAASGRGTWSRMHGRLIAIAASVLIALGIGIVTYQTMFSGTGHDHDHIAQNFASFLNEFDSRPDDAQQVLVANYEGRTTTLQEAAAILGYEPIVTKGLPAGCSLDKVYLLKMPCCTCVQVIGNFESGQSFTIFEHDLEQPAWFGDRPAIEGLCQGVPTSVVQIDDRLAATWKVGERYLTVIGAPDFANVNQFVAYFGGTKHKESRRGG